MSSKLAGIAPEARKKQRIKVQFDIVVRTIDELPSKYSDGKKGELFIEYKKGSGSKNKGSTKMFKPTGSKQMTLNADLTFTVNLTKDLSTGTFDKKIVEFSLKFKRYKSAGLKKDYKVGSLPLDITTFAPSSTFMDVKSFELTGKHKDKTTKTILTLQVKSNYQKIDGKVIKRVKSKRVLGREDSINSNHSDADAHNIITVGTEQFVVGDTNEDTSEANNSEFTHDTEGSIDESMTENDDFSDDQPTLVAPITIDSTSKSPRDGKSPRRNDSGSGLSPGRRERSRSVSSADSKTNSNVATPVKRDSRNSVQFADTKIIVPPVSPGDGDVPKADSGRAMLKEPSILLIENYNPADPPPPSNNVNTNNAEVLTLREANEKMKKEVEMAKDEIKQLKEALSKMKQQLRDKNKTGTTPTGASAPNTPSPPEPTTTENKEELEKLQKKVKELTETLANQNQVHATELARLTANVTALQKDSENTLSLLAQSKQQLELKDKQIKTLQETSLTAAANNNNVNNVNNVSLRTRRKELIQSALKSPLTPEEEQYTLAIILLVFIILSILI